MPGSRSADAGPAPIAGGFGRSETDAKGPATVPEHRPAEQRAVVVGEVHPGFAVRVGIGGIPRRRERQFDLLPLRRGRAAAASSQTELRLVNVARSSLEELLLDYEDFLRHRRLKQWAPQDSEALAVRRVPGQFKRNWSDRSDPSDPSDRTDQTDLTDLTDQQRWALYAPWLEHADPAVRANALICLIHQANYLLDQQINALEQRFVQGGGYSEQLATARLAHRVRQSQEPGTSAANVSIPPCPQCGQPMVLRTARSGKKAGSQFWGCSAYPVCKGVVQL
jgi:restriction system protein